MISKNNIKLIATFILGGSLALVSSQIDYSTFLDQITTEKIGLFVTVVTAGYTAYQEHRHNQNHGTLKPKKVE